MSPFGSNELNLYSFCELFFDFDEKRKKVYRLLTNRFSFIHQFYSAQLEQL